MSASPCEEQGAEGLIALGGQAAFGPYQLAHAAQGVGEVVDPLLHLLLPDVTGAIEIGVFPIGEQLGEVALDACNE